VEGKKIFDGRDTARTRGELSDAVVFAGQDLHVVICQEKEQMVRTEKDGDGAETMANRG